MTNSLKDWKWCIDYSEATWWKNTDLPAPQLFTSREKAQKHNKATFPKGRVIQIQVIKEKR